MIVWSPTQWVGRKIIHSGRHWHDVLLPYILEIHLAGQYVPISVAIVRVKRIAVLVLRLEPSRIWTREDEALWHWNVVCLVQRHVVA